MVLTIVPTVGRMVVREVARDPGMLTHIKSPDLFCFGGGSLEDIGIQKSWSHAKCIKIIQAKAL